MRAVPGQPALTGRLARALGLDSKPLRRASDRAEAWIRAGLLVVFLVAGPMAAVTAGQWTMQTMGAQASTHTAAAQTVRVAQPRPSPPLAAPPAAARAASGPRRDRFAGDAVLAGILALAAVGLALLAAMRVIRRVLNWRRLAAWEQAWRATGPRWTGRRS